MKAVLASHNPGKLKEMQLWLEPLGLELVLESDLGLDIQVEEIGRTFEENMKCNFGMPSPEGYRKAQRLMRQAEKFGRPIFTFIDTPGALRASIPPATAGKGSATGIGACCCWRI